MRLAVVVAPQNAELGPPPSGEPVAPLVEALFKGGWQIAVVPTTRAIEAEFERALDSLGEGDSVLVYVAGATSSDVAVLEVDGDKKVSLRFMSDALIVRDPAEAMFFVDVSHDGDSDDPMFAAEHVDALVATIDARKRGYAALVGVRSRAASTREPGSWPFTRFVLRALEQPESRDEHGAAPMSLVYERMRASTEINAHVQSFAFVKAKSDFELAPMMDVASAIKSVRMKKPKAKAPDVELAPPPSGPRVFDVPQIDPLLALADGARDRKAYEEALAGYKAALMIVPAGDTAGKAAVYARIGEVKRAQGKPREAELNFEKALSASPGHTDSLVALVDLATAAKEFKRAIEWRRKLLGSCERADLRIEQLVEIARIQADELKDARGAITALEEARDLEPRRRDLLERLHAAYEAVHRWPKVVEILGALCDATDAPAERAALRFAQADIALARTRDEARGLELLEAALEDDPTHDKALVALVAVRTARQEWADLDRAYTKLVERFAKMSDVERAWDVCRRLGVLRRDKLRNGPGAIEAFLGAVKCKPSDVDSRAMLAELHLAKADEAAAVGEFETIAQYAPLRASTYARLFVLHSRAGRSDRAWLAAQALEELGAADMDAQLLVDQFRPEGAIRPNAKLDDAAWDAYLRAPGADDVVAGILRAILGAAVRTNVEELAKTKKLVTLDPTKKQAETSTVSMVRSFYWASQIMGIEPPDLHVMDKVPGGIAAAQTAVPATALGADVLRGLMVKDLAFLAARHLTYYRPEHSALIHYPRLEELTTLFLGAVKIAMPEVPVPPNLSAAVNTLRKALLKNASDEERTNLGRAVEKLEARGGRVDLAAWIKSVELTAGRVGLLLCGDLAVATARMRAENRVIAELPFDEKRGDLLAYCASEKFAKVRETLGVRATTSVYPPSMTAAG
jgi:tetratricopeptide (TPR) repeat protein